MNYDAFRTCLEVYHELCKLVDDDNLSEDFRFNIQLKKDFEKLHNYFDALTNCEKVKLEDFVG